MISRHLDTAVKLPSRAISRCCGIARVLLAGVWMALFAPGVLAAAQKDTSGTVLVQALRHFASATADQSLAPGLFFRQAEDSHRIERILVQYDGGSAARMPLSAQQADLIAKGGLLTLGDVPRDAGSAVVEVSARRREAAATETPEIWRVRLPENTLGSGRPLVVELQRNPWTLVGRRLKLQHGEGGAALQAQAADFLLRTNNPLPAVVMLLRLQHRGQLREGDATRLSQALAMLAASQSTSADFMPGRTGSAVPAGGDLSHGAAVLAAFNRATQASTPASRKALEEIGTTTMTDSLGWTVRDRANLVLGYEALRQFQPEEAERALARVRTVGPYTNAARLGLGWAQIAVGGSRATDEATPDRSGAVMRPRGDDAIAEARRNTPFRTAFGVARGDLADSLKRALKPWTDMIGADPLDPAVQESMLAIPYALGHLGAHEDALERTRQALITLEKLEAGLQRGAVPDESQRFVAAMLAPASDAYVEMSLQQPLPQPLISRSGSRWWRQAEWPTFFYAEKLFEQGEYQAQWRHCAQLEQATRLLQSLADAAGFSQSLESKAALCRQQLAQQTQATLSAWSKGVEAYLNEGRLSIARMHDSNALAARRAAGGY